MYKTMQKNCENSAEILFCESRNERLRCQEKRYGTPRNCEIILEIHGENSVKHSLHCKIIVFSKIFFYTTFPVLFEFF